MGIFELNKKGNLSENLESQKEETPTDKKHRFISKVKEYSFDKWKNANPTKSLIDFFASAKEEKQNK